VNNPHLTHDVSLADSITKRAREPNPNERSVNKPHTTHGAPLAGSINNRARETFPNRLKFEGTLPPADKRPRACEPRRSRREVEAGLLLPERHLAAADCRWAMVSLLSDSQGGGPEFDDTYTMAYGTDPDPYGAIPPYQVRCRRRHGAAARLTSRPEGMLAIPGINNSFAPQQQGYGVVGGMMQP
jgi:hypothetical protein